MGVLSLDIYTGKGWVSFDNFGHNITILDCQRKIKKIETQRRIFNIPFEDPRIIDVVFEILSFFFGHSIFT